MYAALFNFDTPCSQRKILIIQDTQSGGFEKIREVTAGLQDIRRVRSSVILPGIVSKSG